MKVEIIEKPESEEIKYPILMENRHTGNIVLFNSVQSGIAIKHPTYPFGSYSDKWLLAYDKSEWKPFTGEIILSNE